MPKTKLPSKRDSRLYDPIGIGTDSKKQSKSREKNEARIVRGPYVESTSVDTTQTNWKSLHQSSAKEGFQIIYGFIPDVYLNSEYDGKINRPC